MTRPKTRREILDQLREKTDRGEPLLLFGAGTGLTAACAERGGADMIGIYSTAVYRMRGLPSLLAWLPYGDANEELRRMAREIVPSVKAAPCIAGVGAHNPSLNLEHLLDAVSFRGFSGVTNEPFCSLYGPAFAGQLERAGIGFSREVELIGRARERELLTVAWVMSPEEAVAMTRAGADLIGAMIGVTTGGLSGAAETVSLEKAVEEVRAMRAAAKDVRSDILVLTHGGPFADVASAERSLMETGAEGYAAGSSGERIPTEAAVIDITKRYKTMKTCW